MELKDIKKIEDALKNEIDAIGQSSERDILARKRCIPIVKQELELIMIKSIQNLYYLIKAFPIIRLDPAFDKKLKESQNLEDYQSNIHLIYDIISHTKNNIIDSLFYKDTNQKHKFVSFIYEIKNFIDNAVYILNIANSNSDSYYVRMVAKMLPSMNSNLEKAGSYIKYLGGFNGEYTEVCNKIIEFFGSSVYILQQFANEYLAEIKKQKQEINDKRTIIDSSKIVKPVVDKQTLERQKLIKEANDKYEEFCLDFMRDLEKQYAYSSKDLYEQFVNVRFKKFVERYPIPIPNDASEGYAKEVINQINILIDHVAKISENSYITSVFKEMK